MNSAPWFCPLCATTHPQDTEPAPRPPQPVAANVGVALNLPRITITEVET